MVNFIGTAVRTPNPKGGGSRGSESDCRGAAAGRLTAKIREASWYNYLEEKSEEGVHRTFVLRQPAAPPPLPHKGLGFRRNQVSFLLKISCRDLFVMRLFARGKL